MRSIKDDDLVIIGKLGASFGIKGELKINPFTEEPDGLLRYRHFHMKTKQGWKPLVFENLRFTGGKMFAKILGCTSPEQANLEYRGKEIAIPKTDLPKLKKNEYYWRDLYHLHVIDKHGTTLGTVIDIQETPVHDLLIVSGNGLAIPYNLVLDVNLAAKTISVNYPIEE